MLMKFDFSWQIFKRYPHKIFIKICLLIAEFHANGQTNKQKGQKYSYVTKLTVAIRSFADATKNWSVFVLYSFLVDYYACCTHIYVYVSMCPLPPIV
jgi:hypothetical protein